MSNFTDLFPAVSSNNVLEMICGIGDGRTVHGVTNSYTMGTAAAIGLTTSYQDMQGSSIDYILPDGANYVHYEYIVKWAATDYSGICNWRLYFDGNEVNSAFVSNASSYGASNHGHHLVYINWVFDLTVSATDYTDGKILKSDWTGAKNIKVMAREYNSSYDARAHWSTWRDGTSTGYPFLDVPLLTITAYS